MLCTIVHTTIVLWSMNGILIKPNPIGKNMVLTLRMQERQQYEKEI